MAIRLVLTGPKSMRWILIFLVMTGCSHTARQSDDLANPYQSPPVGSTIVLKEPLTIPPSRTRLFLQQGSAMLLGDFDRYKPNCNFEVRSLTDLRQTISPDAFIVTKVQRMMTEVVRVHGAKPLPMPAGLDDQGTPMITRGVHLWLGSEKQPDVMRLTCRGAFDDMWAAQPPSIQEIRQALGDLAELVLAI